MNLEQSSSFSESSPELRKAQEKYIDAHLNWLNATLEKERASWDFLEMSKELQKDPNNQHLESNFNQVKNDVESAKKGLKVAGEKKREVVSALWEVVRLIDPEKIPSITHVAEAEADRVFLSSIAGDQKSIELMGDHYYTGSDRQMMIDAAKKDTIHDVSSKENFFENPEGSISIMSSIEGNEWAAGSRARFNGYSLGHALNRDENTNERKAYVIFGKNGLTKWLITPIGKLILDGRILPKKLRDQAKQKGVLVIEH